MFKYSGVTCPVCKKEFTETDDVVVCPDCGTPHHRECYIRNGSCANAEKHGSGEEWTPPEQPEQRNTVSDVHCPYCGTNNPRTNSVCSVCGAPLTGEAPNPRNDTHEGSDAQNGFEQGFGGFGAVPPIAPNPFTTPYGGVDPDETLDDIPAKDYVLFVGNNSFYFLPKFKSFAEKERTFVPNWSAFFFTFFYYLYRKMYLLGLLILAADIILSIPAIMVNLSTMQETMLQMKLITEPMFEINVTQQLVIIANVFNFISLGLRVFLGIYTNKLYYDHAHNKILALRESADAADPDEYCFALARAGRTNRKLILAIVIAFAALYFISVILLSSTFMMM